MMETPPNEILYCTICSGALDPISPNQLRCPRCEQAYQETLEWGSRCNDLERQILEEREALIEKTNT